MSKKSKIKHIKKDSSWDVDYSEFEIRPKNEQQQKYIEAIDNNDIVFGIGTAGSGKTLLAVYKALEYLEQEKIKRIVITRPVVEAQEHLGFLPGDFKAKLDPYLTPMYDAFYELIGSQRLQSLLNTETIVIRPLAFMRGTTFKNCLVIGDEFQNTTKGQLKLFLTRLGEGSKMVITGDITQIDLPNKSQCGLIHAQKILKNVPQVSFIEFGPEDTLRHNTVKNIVTAYATNEPQAETKVKHQGC